MGSLQVFSHQQGLHSSPGKHELLSVHRCRVYGFQLGWPGLDQSPMEPRPPKLPWISLGETVLGPTELHREDFCITLSFWGPPLLFWNWRWHWIFCEWEIKFCQLIVVNETCKHLLSTHYVLGIAAIFIGHCSRLQNELQFSTHPWIHVPGSMSLAMWLCCSCHQKMESISPPLDLGWTWTWTWFGQYSYGSNVVPILSLDPERPCLIPLLLLEPCSSMWASWARLLVVQLPQSAASYPTSNPQSRCLWLPSCWPQMHEVVQLRPEELPSWTQPKMLIHKIMN